MALPLVSVCVPAYEGEAWIGAAVESALAQTYPELEVVVVDDRSSDGTRDVVTGLADPRVRLVVNDRPLGAAGNHNAAVRASRGALVKFLHQDDTLAPACVERMAAVFVEAPRVGLVFSRRRVIVDPTDADAAAWKERYGEVHRGLGPLERVNDGRALRARWLAALAGPELPNLVGEPSAVMVRRAALDRAGPFSTWMRQSWDAELWLRVMAADGVGFLDEPLASFRRHSGSLSERNARENADWLDLAWLYEGLLASAVDGAERALVRRYRRRETARLARRAAGRLARRRGLAGLGAYAGHRAGRARERRPAPRG